MTTHANPVADQLPDTMQVNVLAAAGVMRAGPEFSFGARAQSPGLKQQAKHLFVRGCAQRFLFDLA